MKASKSEKDQIPPAINRLPDLVGWMGSKSHFLFGPRQTGKTFLIHRLFSGIQLYDLLDSSVYLALSRNPGLLEEQLSPENKVVVIDEVQRLPELLNEVHRLIEKRRIRFLLTGSSARKLRRGGVNLLGGRARTRYLHPLTYRELGTRFDLGKGHCPRFTAVCLFLRRSPSRPGRLYRHLSATGNRCGRGDSKRTRLQPIPARSRSVQCDGRQLYQCFQ